MVQMLSVGLLDGAVVVEATRDGRRRIRDGYGGDHERYGEHDDRRRAHDAHERDDADHGAEEKRTGISHEDAGRREVVAQKRQRDAEQDDGEHGRLLHAAPERDDEQEERVVALYDAMHKELYEFFRSELMEKLLPRCSCGANTYCRCE